MKSSEEGRYSERELKFDASHVSVEHFKRWAFAWPSEESVTVAGTDDYYRHGVNVIRHRHSQRDNMLTVKCRKTADSIQDRVEVDVRLHRESPVKDVRAFLAASGWEPVFSLYKTAEIAWIWSSGLPYDIVNRRFEFTVCFYEVTQIGTDKPPRRFLEVEFEKDNPYVPAETIDQLLQTWRATLTAEFGLGAPLSESLFEIYSGERYIVKGA